MENNKPKSTESAGDFAILFRELENLTEEIGISADESEELSAIEELCKIANEISTDQNYYITST